MGGCSFSGFRADGRRFLLMNIFGGGWGGRPREDGESASVSICQGDVRNAPVELQEIQYPFLIERFALRQDSGGAGRHRGGLGVELTYRALAKTLTNVNCERTKDPPWGLNGGVTRRRQRGAVGAARRQRTKTPQGDRDTDGGRRPPGLPHRRGRRLGRSAPAQPARVADDVAKGYVSAQAARRDYGFDDAQDSAAE